MKKRNSQRKTLSSGRPPTANKAHAALSKRTTQTLIRSHHQTMKQLNAAEASGHADEVERLKQRLNEHGGLKSYQLASIQGQSNERGGDSSKILLEWLEDARSELSSLAVKMRMLEVGALSTKNACSRSNLFAIERIDLHSQAEGILQQDFMQRPLPASDEERFDIISLSLVLNFVPSPEGRGDMLSRTCQFLLPESRSRSIEHIFPALFLVLPAACVANSRYMTEERLVQIMAALGYVMIRRKQTAKLIYYLWKMDKTSNTSSRSFPKTQINPGNGRNNFSIAVRG